MTRRGGAASFPSPAINSLPAPALAPGSARVATPHITGAECGGRGRNHSDSTGANAKRASMIKKMSPSENEFDIPAKNRYRMVILGSTKVGKTAIISRFLNERFDDQYTPTIEDFHRKFYSIRGDVYQLDILDTSGNHPFPAMRRLSILTGEPRFKINYPALFYYGC